MPILDKFVHFKRLRANMVDQYQNLYFRDIILETYAGVFTTDRVSMHKKHVDLGPIFLHVPDSGEQILLK